MTLGISPAQIVADAEASGNPGLLARAPGWDRVRLGDIARVVNGAAFSSSLFNAEGRGWPLVRIRDVGSDRTATYYDGDFDDAYVLDHDDILVSMDGDFRVARWAGSKALLNQRVCRIVVDEDKYDSRFLVLVLQGYLDAIWKATSSVTVKHLSSRSIADIPLPQPRIGEQRRIVEILEDQLSRLDAADDLVVTLEPRVERLRARAVDAALSIPRSSVVCGQEVVARMRDERDERADAGRARSPAPPDLSLGELSTPWPVVSLEAATDPLRTIRYGILKPRTASGGAVPYVEVKDLKGNTLREKDLNLTSPELDEQFAGARLSGGDVVVAVRGSYERSAVVPPELAGSNVSRDVARIACLPSLLPEFLHLWLQSNYSKRYLHSHARGVAVKGVNIATLRAMPIPIPSVEVQATIVAEVDACWTGLTSGYEGVLAVLRRADHLRRALLTVAVRGELTHGART